MGCRKKSSKFKHLASFVGLARVMLYLGCGHRSPPPKPDPKGIIVNIHKNMEVIFVIALAVVGMGSWLLDSVPAAQAVAKPVPVARNIATPTSMAVVIIRAPRVRNAD
jgi:hypothetical protein